MSTTNLSDIPSKEVMPGFRGKFVHSENMTYVHWEIEKGAVLPLHHHMHEQLTNLIEGEFEMTVGGETKVLKSGDVAVIPSNVEHEGVAKTACQIIDVFSPRRDDLM